MNFWRAWKKNKSSNQKTVRSAQTMSCRSRRFRRGYIWHAQTMWCQASGTSSWGLSQHQSLARHSGRSGEGPRGFPNHQITKDVQEFYCHGIELTGWANWQILYCAFLNPEAAQDGPYAQAEYPGFEQFPYYPRGQNPCRFEANFIGLRSKLHSNQNMGVLFAIFLRAAINRAKKLGIELDSNILPLCHEALDLVKSLQLSPEGKQRIGKEIADNWRPVVCQDGEERVIPHSNGLNDVKLVNEMRMSRSDLFEPSFEKNKGPSEEELTRVRSHWLKWDLPTCGMMSNNLCPALLRQNICWSCRSDQHNHRSCQKKLETCRYPHFNTGGRPKPRPDP